jgi:hypothetical protein
VREAALQVLADHVNVLEVALQEVAVVDRRHAGGVVDGIDDLGALIGVILAQGTFGGQPNLSFFQGVCVQVVSLPLSF